MLIHTAKKSVFKRTAFWAVLCFLSFVSIKVSAANVTDHLKASWTEQTRMNLGHWRHSIAERINPNFYAQLNPSHFENVAADLSYQGAKLYFNADRFQQLSKLIDGKSYFFTFIPIFIFNHAH